jgi:hypothetical protein
MYCLQDNLDDVTNIVNMTPHPVVILRERKAPVTLRPCGVVPRVEDRASSIGNVSVGFDVPIMRIETGMVLDLPPREPDVLLLVSRITAQAMPGRQDLVFPHDLVRNESGQIVGCKALGTFASSGRDPDCPLTRHSGTTAHCPECGDL